MSGRRPHTGRLRNRLPTAASAVAARNHRSTAGRIVRRGEGVQSVAVAHRADEQRRCRLVGVPPASTSAQSPARLDAGQPGQRILVGPQQESGEVVAARRSASRPVRRDQTHQTTPMRRREYRPAGGMDSGRSAPVWRQADPRAADAATRRRRPHDPAGPRMPWRRAAGSGPARPARGRGRGGDQQVGGSSSASLIEPPVRLRILLRGDVATRRRPGRTGRTATLPCARR